MFKSKYLKYLVTFVLVTIFLLSSFSISSYADNSITYRLADFQLLDITDTPSVFSTQEIGGVTYTSVGYYSPDDGKLSLFYKLSDELKAGDSYTISFNVFRATGMEGFSEVYFALSDSPTQYEDVVNIASFSTSEISKGGSKRFSIQFTYPENKFNGKQCYILCSILSPKGYSLFYLSDIVFTNNNQTDEKIDGILEWLNKIYNSILTGTNTLNSKLTTVTNDLKSKLDDCTNSLNSTLKSQLNILWSNLNTLLNNINSNILSFKSSVESSFNNLSTFLDSKFTILFDKLDTLIKGKDISEDDFDTSGKDNIDNINKDIEDTESNLPDFDGSDFDKVINTDILSDLSKGFIAVNSVFSIVVDKLGFTAVIVFFLSFGLAIYIIGRRLG